VDPKRYEVLAPELMEIRWPPEQRLEDVKSFLDRVIAESETQDNCQPDAVHKPTPPESKEQGDVKQGIAGDKTI
jgi:hypothetical protein